MGEMEEWVKLVDEERYDKCGCYMKKNRVMGMVGGV